MNQNAKSPSPGCLYYTLLIIVSFYLHFYQSVLLVFLGVWDLLIFCFIPKYKQC